MDLTMGLKFAGWRGRLSEFAKNEWPKAPLGAAIGVLCAIFEEAIRRDSVFQTRAANKWVSVLERLPFGGWTEYRSLLVVLLVILCVAVAPRLLRLAVRVVKSWMLGIVSGMSFLWAVSFFLGFGFGDRSLLRGSSVAIVLAVAFSAVCFALGYVASVKEPQPPHFVLPVSKAGTSADDIWTGFDSDSPIEEWGQDRLNRSAFIESVAMTVVVSHAPVIAIQGPYGDGKSSVINLLDKTLRGNAVVVKFSSWLPGSEKTLAADIFNDIATDCRKRYYVPQLRRRLLAYAKTLSGSVSFLKNLPDLLPPPSQRKEIEDLRKVLARVPGRIVVLLDEMDRMQEEELRVLLKILRGVAVFPNLCYVCAFNRSAIEKALFEDEDRDSHEYCEKFFPVVFDVPKADSALLYEMFRSELTGVFGKSHWFGKDGEKVFLARLKELWDDTAVKLCTNLRQVGLVLNDVRYAARPITGEVNPFDLVVLEMLRRFFPSVYEQVWRHQEYFTDSENWKSLLYSDDVVKREHKEFFTQLQTVLDRTRQPRVAADLLWWLFPSYAKFHRRV